MCELNETGNSFKVRLSVIPTDLIVTLPSNLSVATVFVNDTSEPECCELNLVCVLNGFTRGFSSYRHPFTATYATFGISSYSYSTGCADGIYSLWYSCFSCCDYSGSSEENNITKK